MARMQRIHWVLMALAALLIMAATGCDIEEMTDPEPTPTATPTPLSGSVEQSIPLTLAWSLTDEVAWTDSFLVCVDTLRHPEIPVYAGTDTSCTLGDLLDGQQYYWTVTAADSTGKVWNFGPWSFEVRPFRCRVNPLPENLTLNVETDPTMSWSVRSASDTVRYWLAYVDTVNPPQQLAYAGPDSSFQMTGLEYETEYFWRVTAVDAADNTDTSGPWRFFTGPPVFMVEMDPTPATGEVDLERVVDLAWQVTDTTAPVSNYVVFLDDQPQPTTMVYAGTDSTVTLTNLRYGLTYYWAVTAFDEDGHTFQCGPWELTLRDFDVTLTPSPADGSTMVSTTGMLSWDVTSGMDLVANYLICLDTHDQPTTPVYTGPSTSVDLSSLGLSPGTTYYWRVTALDADGYTCPLGPWSFTTAP